MFTFTRFCIGAAAVASMSAAAVSVASAQGSDSAHAVAFDRMDRRARDVDLWLQWLMRTEDVRKSGQFGAVDSVGKHGMCVARHDELLGVLFNSDSACSEAHDARVISLARKTREVTPFDTAGMIAECRAMYTGLRSGALPDNQTAWQFAPSVIRSDGDTIEVWLVPTALLMGESEIALGGERGFLFAPNGKTLVRHIDARPKQRVFRVPADGPIAIPSSKDDIPLLTELFAVNTFHLRGRAASVSTKTFNSALVGAEPNSMWLQMRIKH